MMPVENHLGKLENFDLFHLSIIYLLYKSFYRFLFYSSFLSIMSLLIWSCKKPFFILWYCPILIIFLNILFESARCLNKHQILPIAKNTSLFKAFNSKIEKLSDVILTVYFNKRIWLSKCELSTDLARRK